MKYRTTSPRMLPNGKRADYYGVRITFESAYEEQAAAQLYPGLGRAPKGRRTDSATETWMHQVQKAVEHRAHLLSMGMPVQDTEAIGKRVEEWIGWGNLKGGKKGLPWGEGVDYHHRNHLRFWIQELNLKTLSDIRQGPFDQVVARLAKTYAHNTVNHYAYSLSGICSWAARARYIPASPIRFRALDRTPENPRGAFTLDELRILFEGVPWMRSVIYKTAYYLRFRRNECDSLQVSSVQFAAGLMRLDYLDAKDREPAMKPIPASLLKDLWEITQGKAPDAPLFSWSKKNAAKVLHRDMERLGIPLMRDGKKRDFHSLGHSTATSMDRHGVGPALASKYMRHKTWAQTQEYVNHEVEQERVVGQGLENEIEHKYDAPEEKMALRQDGATGYADATSSLSPSAHPRTNQKHTGKIAKFRRFARDKRKAPEVSWEIGQEILAQCQHTIRDAAGAHDLAAFLKLSPAQRAAALANAKRKAGAA
jgi:hypothetical protein